MNAATDAHEVHGQHHDDHLERVGNQLLYIVLVFFVGAAFYFSYNRTRKALFPEGKSVKFDKQMESLEIGASTGALSLALMTAVKAMLGGFGPAHGWGAIAGMFAFACFAV